MYLTKETTFTEGENMKTGKYTERVGKKFRQIRKMKEKSLGDVSRETGINKGYLSRLERNKIPNVPLSRLEELADYYNIDLSNLLREGEDWFEKLPPKLQYFVEHHDIEYLELGMKAQEKGLDPEDVEEVINLLAERFGKRE